MLTGNTMLQHNMKHWSFEGGVDGFLIQPAISPVGLMNFVDQVVRGLQRRGVFRIEYEGKTLRENLVLTRPVSGCASAEYVKATE